ncbi:MAG: hypothetical protein P8018_07740 [Acidobacteriota bacterium]
MFRFAAQFHPELTVQPGAEAFLSSTSPVQDDETACTAAAVIIVAVGCM